MERQERLLGATEGEHGFTAVRNGLIAFFADTTNSHEKRSAAPEREPWRDRRTDCSRLKFEMKRKDPRQRMKSRTGLDNCFRTRTGLVRHNVRGTGRSPQPTRHGRFAGTPRDGV